MFLLIKASASLHISCTHTPSGEAIFFARGVRFYRLVIVCRVDPSKYYTLFSLCRHSFIYILTVRTVSPISHLAKYPRHFNKADDDVDVDDDGGVIAVSALLYRSRGRRWSLGRPLAVPSRGGGGGGGVETLLVASEPQNPAEKALSPDETIGS